MNPDRSLTIILTLKDRAPFTFRWMAYANLISLPFKVLIADGGKESIVSDVLSKSENFPNVNYEYIRYPYDQTYSEYHAKKADVVSRIDTPFATMADNDDFFIVEGLNRSFQFLERNPDYSTCRGQIGFFYIKPDSGATYGKDVEFSNQTSCDSVLSRTAAHRIREHLTSYMITYYDVHRTEDLRMNFQILQDLDLQDFSLAELLLSLLTVATGKVRREPYFSLLRQIGLFNSNAQREARRADLFDRMLLESWSDEFTKFVNQIATTVSNKDGISLNDARSHVKKCYRTYAAPVIVNCLSSEETLHGNSLVCKTKSLINRLRYVNIPTTRVLLKLLLNVRRFMVNRSVTRINRSSEYWDDIKQIYDFLTARHSVDPSLDS